VVLWFELRASYLLGDDLLVEPLLQSNSTLKSVGKNKIKRDSKMVARGRKQKATLL
jgi:hypothetical protein